MGQQLWLVRRNVFSRRFGGFPAERRRQIEAIDSPEELTRLADRLLVARSVDELGI